MTNIWTDAELASAEGHDDGEAYDEAYDDAYDDAYDEESRAERRRRRDRARRLAAARARSRARQGQVVSRAPQPSAQQTVRAVENLDVETKVQRDDLQRAIAGINKRAYLANLGTVGTVLVPLLFETFGTPDNTFVRFGAQVAPSLLAVSPRPRGIAGYLTSPPTIAFGSALALAFVKNHKDTGNAVRQVTILGPTELETGEEDVFLADALDAQGRTLVVSVAWSSNNPDVAQIDASTGQVRVGSKTGVAVITATVAGVPHRARLRVVAAGSNAPGDIASAPAVTKK